ncbi:MAG: hypothetical protein DMG64_17335 [Acidobacteria bacterium]|nr:MAG: hypothetical protein DMG64_17335 [Acidobacteriota bacterium]
MPDTLVGQPPATGSTSGTVFKTPGVTYDGQNAGVQQQRLGLGITEVTDAFRSPQARMVGYFIDLLVLGFFLMCGYMAGKFHKWAFVMGMAFYALDAGLTAMAQDWISFAFHVYAIVCIWRGFSHVNAAKDSGQVAVLSGK